MRNYIILNGNRSSLIDGLLIQTLPAISKPAKRTQIETIDGRDGDIVTDLGYSAYDKTIKIGLYNDYDINEIISYFDSEGVVTFSNEPDKYYNYQIIQQIDFERLIRYKTATVVFHVQPFKYLVDEPIATNMPEIELKKWALPVTVSGLTVSSSGRLLRIQGQPSVNPCEIRIPLTESITCENGTYIFECSVESADTMGLVSVSLGHDEPTSANLFAGSTTPFGLYTTNQLKATFTSPVTFTYIYIKSTTAAYSNISFYGKIKLCQQVGIVVAKNEGNVISKPKYTISGNSSIGLEINGTRRLTVNFTSEDHITIDVAALEAYKDNTLNLKNRLVTGNYEDLALAPGNNFIRLDYVSAQGTIDPTITIEDCSRWL